MIFTKKTNKKKKRRSPMRRKVYLMERKTNRTCISILKGKREIKIGIAKNSEERHKSVNSGIPGRVVVIAEYSISRASTVEAELHRKYKSKNFTVKNAKSGSGSTEFFRLTTSEVGEIKRYLKKKSGKSSNDRVIFIITLICLLVVYYLTINK